MPSMLLHAKEIFLTYISPVHYNTIRCGRLNFPCPVQPSSLHLHGLSSVHDAARQPATQARACLPSHDGCRLRLFRRKETLRTLKPALSLTRRSIIQEAIDKAEKVLLCLCIMQALSSPNQGVMTSSFAWVRKHRCILTRVTQIRIRALRVLIGIYCHR